MFMNPSEAFHFDSINLSIGYIRLENPLLLIIIKNNIQGSWFLF